MAKELVVTDNLTEDMISAGAKLIERLDATSSEVAAALWYYFPEDRGWKLIIASSKVTSEGPKSFYKQIKESNKQSEENEKVVFLKDISITDSNNPLMQLFKFAVSTGPGISGIRFSKNSINGQFIDDSYIYRINIDE
ncbi:MAG: hypothetical protein JRI28_04275 [Deltaproteobacteria bacterium]|nr:hypothetical protein [Deltaproteobacteria bacterium]